MTNETKKLAEKLWKVGTLAANKVQQSYSQLDWDHTELSKLAWLAIAKYVLRNFDKKTRSAQPKRKR